MFNQVLGTGYNGYREAIWKLALSLCILVVLALCFYKAFRLIAVFLTVAFQAVADISKYAAVIPLAKLGDGVVGVWNRCVEKGLFKSDMALMMTLNGSMLAVQIFQYLVIAMLLYISL